MTNSAQGKEPLLAAEAISDNDDWTRLASTWRDEAPEGLATVLSFLSDKAACFYLPAFIAADLRGELKRLDPAFYLTHGFDSFLRELPVWPRARETWSDYEQRRWSRLTSEQARAIVRYLKWRIDMDGAEIARNIIEPLSGFWYDRAKAPHNGS